MASTIEEKEDSGRQTRLVCMDCGHTADPLRERVFKCPACGGLYDVHHKDWWAPSAYTRTSVFDERALPCQSVYHNPECGDSPARRVAYALHQVRTHCFARRRSSSDSKGWSAPP